MKTLKKPYEISLWEEQLVWHRRKLGLIEITSKDDYKRGAYYVKSDALGADSYELSYEDYRNAESQQNNPYFQLLPLDEKKTNWLEGYTSDEIKISPSSHSTWYSNGEMVPNVISSFYKETRLCTIGSNTMDSPARAVNGKLVRKVNGEVTFTFTMYYRYFDNQTGQLEYNPFVPYLTNERKIKLKYDGEWYDLIIKQVQENSESKAFTYTCKSQFVNELSKTGFELEFDNELENNMGTVEYLAEQILEGSDWQLEGNSNLKQFIEEPLYRITLGQEIPAKDMETNKEEAIAAGQKIYAFYSQINDKKDELQFLFVNTTKFDENGDSTFITNDDLVIDKVEHHNYILSNVVYDENGWPALLDNEKKPSPIVAYVNKIAQAEISTKYRGMRLVKQARTVYDAKIDKYVQEYTKTGTDTVYYGFEETKYLSPNAVNNYAVNPNAFTSTAGWYVQPNAQGAKATLELVSDPPFSNYEQFSPQSPEDLIFCYEYIEGKYVKTTDTTIGDSKRYYRLSLGSNFTSYLKFPNNGGALVNSSINSHKSSLEGFTKGKDKYILRLKYKATPSGESSKALPSSIKICRYKNMDKFEIEEEFAKNEEGALTSEPGGDVYFSFSEYVPSTEEIESTNPNFRPSESNKILNGNYAEVSGGGYLCFEATCLQSLSEADLKNWDKYYGLFIKFNGEEEIYIEDIQLFPYVLDNNNRLCVPDGELFSKVETVKRYYDPNQNYTSLDEVVFEKDDGNFVLKYAEGAEAYTKVSSITAKESNRFNLLQDLNEKFECWARFRVEHNEDGSIQLGKDRGLLTGDEAYRQQKFISFHEYAGAPNPVGFKYGINSKSIQRTQDSNAIVSKMIVKDNANEFARNGFCSIARAVDNSSKENFVLNFDHYYRHKLLDLDTVTNDLYLDSGGHLGYYKKLKEINQDRDALIDKQSSLLKEIANYEAQYQTYKTSYDSAVEEQNQMEDNIFLLIVPPEQRASANGLGFEEIIAQYSSGWETNSSYTKYATSWMQCDNVIKQHLPLYQKAEEYLRDCENQYKEITETLKTKTEQKRALNLQFYKKYSRFIQEGSWIKEDYVDDNLYYLDSLSTLHTSAQPKVTYNISVVDVSPLAAQEGYEDFAYYDFKLGDITYIEDREFFGYSLIDGTTPYREEIVVSEITTELDAPEKNSIKVQNYKTQFEDLFQRITAQTQQAEYHTGEYKRAASIVEPGGSISASTLENSFANNSFKLSNVRDQSVIIDSSGITTTSLANPSEMLRIVNGGIFMSTDGGQSWKTGLTGYGLNSSYLTAGQINTDEIYIMSGNQPAFGWDEKGISAYKRNGSHYELDSCVRFNQYGIYGITNNENYRNIYEVMESAPFALTWEGFSLKNNEGSVKITSADDISVLKDKVERIKIGRIGKSFDENGNTVTDYGICIKNSEDEVVMETDSKGELWLRDKMFIGENGLVRIGKLNSGEVINANNGQFIVKANGEVIAQDAQITGKIIATEGYIGNVLIQSNTGITSLKVGKSNSFSIDLQREDGNYYSALKFFSNEAIFYGVINAQNGGNIGGFKIEEGILVSQNNNLKLDGELGEIIASSIELGTGARIADYIQLGNGRLQNPVNPKNPEDIDRPFISAGNGTLELYQGGLIKAGDIRINGTSSTIEGNKFSITPDTARFDNIIASGSIETAIFKQGSVQAAGGAMIFSPSYKINGINGKTITLDQTYMGEIGDIVWIAAPNENENENEKIESTVLDIDSTRKEITLSSNLSGEYLYGALIQIGNENSLIIGINSGSSTVWERILGLGLTVDKYGNSGLPKLFLGDLNSVGLNGYGLYSDNVYLNGSLTTSSNTGKYAGVNTLSGVQGNTDWVGSTGNIIFWAGAEDNTDEAIRKAPFQVTEDGYVFLKNSLFAGGIITGTELRAVKIRGWENGDSAALSIYDTSNGISFKTDEGDKELFAIDGQGLKIGSEYFIKVENNQAIFKTKGNINYLSLQEAAIEDKMVPALFHHHSEGQQCGIFFDNNKTSFVFKSGNEEINTASFSNSEIIFTRNVILDSGTSKMQYKPVEKGYDLFII